MSMSKKDYDALVAATRRTFDSFEGDSTQAHLGEVFFRFTRQLLPHLEGTNPNFSPSRFERAMDEATR